MSTEKPHSFATLSLIAEAMKQFKIPELTPVNAKGVITLELVGWGARLYCFSWLRHVSKLSDGIVTLESVGNTPSARIIARSLYELGAHAYYLKKHLRQYTNVGDLSRAWEFLTPVAVGSRYISEQNRKDSEMFPSPPHIKKVINCFGEKLPPYAKENYSYLSEFSHPNVLPLMQYYEWSGPGTVKFADQKPPEGVFGPTVAAIIQGLLAVDDLLLLAKEKTVRGWLHQLFEGMAQQIG